MCGIAGVYSRTKIHEKKLQRAIEKMRHRGPDAAASWSKDTIALAMSRLAIIDHTSGHNQPMQRGTLTIVFNGEIYNYKKLRQQLSKEYKFTTQSDTEVLICAYAKWKENVVDHIYGMFAFAIYDEETKELFCCRDAVGQKPFVYTENKNGFYFASEIPALLKLCPSAGKEIDVTALKLFMSSSFNHIPAPFTAYKLIKKMMPGSWLKVKAGKIIDEKQWYHLSKKKQTKTTEQIISEVCTEMKVTEVPSASLLSGGIDSALITIKTGCTGYTLAMSDNDTDAQRAKQVTEKQYIFDFEPETFLEEVDAQIKQVGEPYFHPTNIYADQILSSASVNNKVVFSGVGGDEVYAGYNNLSYLRGNLFCTLFNTHRWDLKSDLQLKAYQDIKHLFLDQSEHEVEDYVMHLNIWVENFADTQNFLEFSYISGLFYQNSYAMTMHGDIAGMRHSVEVRAPFLDTRVIENGFSLPLSQKILWWRPTEGKKPLRRMLSEYLPWSFVYAKKKGFGVDYSNTQEILETNKERIKNVLATVALSNIFNMFQIGNAYRQKNFTLIMKLYAIGIWLEQRT